MISSTLAIGESTFYKALAKLLRVRQNSVIDLVSFAMFQNRSWSCNILEILLLEKVHQTYPVSH